MLRDNTHKKAMHTLMKETCITFDMRSSCRGLLQRDTTNGTLRTCWRMRKALTRHRFHAIVGAMLAHRVRRRWMYTGSINRRLDISRCPSYPMRKRTVPRVGTRKEEAYYDWGQRPCPSPPLPRQLELSPWATFPKRLKPDLVGRPNRGYDKNFFLY